MSSPQKHSYHGIQFLSEVFNVQRISLSQPKQTTARVAVPLYRFNVLGDSILTEILIRRYRVQNPKHYLITIERSNQNVNSCLSSEHYPHPPDEIWKIPLNAMNVRNSRVDKQLIQFMNQEQIDRLLLTSKGWMEHLKGCEIPSLVWNLWTEIREAFSRGEYPYLVVPEKLRQWGRRFLEDLGTAESAFRVAIHIRDEVFHPYKNLDVNKYMSLIQWLIEDRQTEVLLIGRHISHEKVPVEIANQLRKISYNHEYFKDITQYELNVMQTAAILSQCHLYIGGDTGPTHLAAAVGVPIVGCDYWSQEVGPFTSPDRFTRLMKVGKIKQNIHFCEYQGIPLEEILHVVDRFF